MSTIALQEILTPMEVGNWLCLPTRKVERLAKAGQIPSVRLPDGSIVFRVDQLSKWFDSLQPGELAGALGRRPETSDGRQDQGVKYAS